MSGALSLRFKWLDCKFDNSRQPSAKVKNGGTIPGVPHTSTWHDAQLIKHRDNFTSTLSYTLPYITFRHLCTLSSYDMLISYAFSSVLIPFLSRVLWTSLPLHLVVSLTVLVSPLLSCHSFVHFPVAQIFNIFNCHFMHFCTFYT
jgi:hypothetical protein